MAIHFWYILIHIGLGLVGFEVFTFSNIGGIYAFGAAAVVQGYAVWEIHRLAWPRFQSARAAEASHMQRDQMLRDYRVRLARTWFFRCCIYSLLTIVVAMTLN
jgi:hypothetical protein